MEEPEFGAFADAEMVLLLTFALFMYTDIQAV